MNITKIFDYKYFHFDKEINLFRGGTADVSDFLTAYEKGSLSDYFVHKYGQFGLVYESEDEIILATDIIGSQSLFYHVSEDNIIVGDDAFRIAARMKISLNKLNLKEYINSSFVSYERTLFDGVNQVLPGEYISISKTTQKIVHYPYFVLHYNNGVQLDMEELSKNFYDTLKVVFGDLIKRLSGRTVLVPLSGGFDSRTVAVILKELGYEKVICFSYGKRGNSEAVISEKVANRLGYQWIFIEYSGEKWKELFKSKDYENFLYYSCKGRATGCIQALPAIRELKRNKEVPEDSVVIPGHTLDVLAGSHLYVEEEEFPITKEKYIDILADMHYSNGKGLSKYEKVEGRITEKLPDYIDQSTYLYQNQKWEYFNRQCKFIANDAKTYELFGYACELPFWDIRICSFWENVPFKLLKHRKLQTYFTQAYINGLCDIDEPAPLEHEDQSAKAGIKGKIKNFMMKFPRVWKWSYIFYLFVTKKYSGEGDWPAFWDMSRMEYLRHCLYYGAMTVNGRASRDYIKLIRRQLGT